MRTADETINLLLQAMDKRRQYLRRKVRRIEARGIQPGKGRPNESNRLKYSGRVGMLSEHATIRGMLERIQDGRMHPDEMYNEEDDTDDD
ncbi:hypothetical protein [Paenibacillus sp. DMB5]|uniref:hypothetical protein n=1 Tax=Paenibacillus sp. DMB5 TaxID=1780103 RepID=UPI00076BFECC|nr:hypothetical protein [Paenibacillus sp. DMB5]KUP22392.1 hypothetical protein AWJ19_27625 [Paenibacillus sp. DMB5]